MGARSAARRALRSVEGGSFASRALDRELGGLAPRDRALATELVYGVLRHRSRLDRALTAMATKGRLKAPPPVLTALRLAAYQLLFLERVPAHAAVDDAVREARRVGGPRVGGFVNGLLRRLARQGEPSLDGVDPAELHSMPGWIVAELAQAGAELPAALAGFNEPAPLCARVNRLRASREQAAEALVAEGAEVRPAGDHALWITGLGDPAASQSFQSGLWTVQDLGAQRVTELAEPEPGMRLLDACAGVGGKATHLAELLGGSEGIDAADVSDTKLARLEQTAARLGLSPIRTIVADLTAADAPLAERYDVVVLDAPCSGLGVLRRHPERKWLGTSEQVVRMAELQQRLLAALAPRAQVLVYSVCTFTEREGSGQISAFLRGQPEFRLDRELRTWPHEDGADGFYAARLVR